MREVFPPDLFARVAARYAGSGRAVRGYVAGKLGRDPVHRAVLETASSRGGLGNVLDLGCGRGQLGIALLEAGLARSVLCLDRAPAQLRQARLAGAGLAFRVADQDLAASQALPEADTVLMVDVLYQLRPEAQHAILRNAACAARRAVLIRALDPHRGWRSALTLGFERAARRFSPHSGARIAPLPISEIAGILREAGFDVHVAPCWHGTPFSNVLLTAMRGAGEPLA